MPMQKRASIRTMLVAAALISPLATGACRNPSPVQEANAPAVNNAAAADPAPKLLPAPERPLDREALLIAVVRARSAAAASTDDRAQQADMDGARFTFRIRLGCRWQTEGEGGDRTATANVEARRVELSAAPDLTLEHPLVAALAGDGFEAAEGFWIRSPWLLVPACPAADSVPAMTSVPGEAAAAPGGTGVGIAQFYTAEDSRAERRDGRSYVARATWRTSS
jgi:hypothetical protein